MQVNCELMRQKLSILIPRACSCCWLYPGHSEIRAGGLSGWPGPGPASIRQDCWVSQRHWKLKTYNFSNNKRSINLINNRYIFVQIDPAALFTGYFVLL